MRQAIVAAHRETPSCSMATLRSTISGLPRNSTAAYVRRLRRLLRRRRRRQWRVVRWHLPGAVWAIDGTWLDQPVQPLGRRALIVVELFSRKVLALESVQGERAAATERLLEKLIARHGPPLVLKLDNGSAFIARRTARLCRRHGITLMHSPVRCPRWNGTCEVSGRWAKRRALAAGCQRGSPDLLCQADLDAAVTFVGVMPRIDSDLRCRFQRLVADQLTAVAAERGLAIDARISDPMSRSLARVAVRRALKICHILTIEGREYRRWLPPAAA